eukprot:TRINITY_DN712_c0_g2_i2.p1 TRINITY_DN712_c0_g2~~TRINITY_DN712_c0_g2_i2.p1  ORF type:complete len:1149 (+),score=276.09 TRINITY_DN712_c0_g2_i2:186-3449(+)
MKYEIMKCVDLYLVKKLKQVKILPFQSNDVYLIKLSSLDSFIKSYSKRISLFTRLYDTVHRLQWGTGPEETNILRKNGTTWEKAKAKKRTLTASDKKYVASLQGWQCAWCGNMLPARFEVDHIVQHAEGGTDDPENLQALCPNCHADKTEMDRQVDRMTKKMELSQEENEMRWGSKLDDVESQYNSPDDSMSLMDSVKNKKRKYPDSMDHFGRNGLVAQRGGRNSIGRGVLGRGNTGRVGGFGRGMDNRHTIRSTTPSSSITNFDHKNASKFLSQFQSQRLKSPEKDSESQEVIDQLVTTNSQHVNKNNDDDNIDIVDIGDNDNDYVNGTDNVINNVSKKHGILHGDIDIDDDMRMITEITKKYSKMEEDEERIRRYTFNSSMDESPPLPFGDDNNKRTRTELDKLSIDLENLNKDDNVVELGDDYDSWYADLNDENDVVLEDNDNHFMSTKNYTTSSTSDVLNNISTPKSTTTAKNAANSSITSSTTSSTTVSPKTSPTNSTSSTSKLKPKSTPTPSPSPSPFSTPSSTTPTTTSISNMEPVSDKPSDEHRKQTTNPKMFVFKKPITKSRSPGKSSITKSKSLQGNSSSSSSSSSSSWSPSSSTRNTILLLRKMQTKSIATVLHWLTQNSPVSPIVKPFNLKDFATVHFQKNLEDIYKKYVSKIPKNNTQDIRMSIDQDTSQQQDHDDGDGDNDDDAQDTVLTPNIMIESFNTMIDTVKDCINNSKHRKIDFPAPQFVHKNSRYRLPPFFWNSEKYIKKLESLLNDLKLPPLSLSSTTTPTTTTTTTEHKTSRLSLTSKIIGYIHQLNHGDNDDKSYYQLVTLRSKIQSILSENYPIDPPTTMTDNNNSLFFSPLAKKEITKESNMWFRIFEEICLYRLNSIENIKKKYNFTNKNTLEEEEVDEEVDEEEYEDEDGVKIGLLLTEGDGEDGLMEKEIHKQHYLNQSLFVTTTASTPRVESDYTRRAKKRRRLSYLSHEDIHQDDNNIMNNNNYNQKQTVFNTNNAFDGILDITINEDFMPVETEGISHTDEIEKNNNNNNNNDQYLQANKINNNNNRAKLISDILRQMKEEKSSIEKKGIDYQYVL